MTVLLEMNGKRCERLHSTMSCVLTGESTSPIVPAAHDGNPRQTLQQDRNGFSYRLYRIQQGKQAYTDHNRLIDRLARSDTDPEQVRQHNHQGVHQTLPTQTYVPPVPIIR